MTEPADLAERIADWRRALRALSDEDLLAEVARQLSNSGWVVMKAHYMRALRDEIEHRGLTESDAYVALSTRVIFLDRP